MYNFTVEADLAISHLENNDSLNKLIHASVKRKTRDFQPDKPTTTLFWPKEHFHLQHSQLFKQATKTQQDAILQLCNDTQLSSYYFLEKSGMAYCAKMILLGQTTEIRQIYALLAADEAIHLQWLTPFVPMEQRTQPQGKLLMVLGKIIEDCDQNTLYYLVQSIVEGWGVKTMKWILTGCVCPSLQKVIGQVLKDEAIHYQTGCALFDSEQLDDSSKRFIYERMQAYMDVVRVGPQTIIQCLEKVLGEFSLSTLTATFEDFKTQMTSRIFLQLMQSLMQQPGMEALVDRLEQDGYMRPYSASEAAKIYQASRI